MPVSRNERKRVKVNGLSYAEHEVVRYKVVGIKDRMGRVFKKVRETLLMPFVKHPRRQKLDERKPLSKFHLTVDMAISYIGNGELEGSIANPDVVVHATNRATLIRKAKRQLNEKYRIGSVWIVVPKPSKIIEGVVL